MKRTENPLYRDADIIGRRFTVVACEAREHGDNDGCVCALIGKKVRLTAPYMSPFVGTASYHAAGTLKTFRLSELGMKNRMNQALCNTISEYHLYWWFHWMVLRRRFLVPAVCCTVVGAAILIIIKLNIA